MRKVKNTYNIINGIVLLIAIFIFFQEYCGDIHLQKERDVLSFTILIAAVVFAHMIKAGRLYLALYGADIGWETYLKVYCKVTPVSMIFPLKVGEFFRMYCYGKELNYHRSFRSFYGYTCAYQHGTCCMVCKWWAAIVCHLCTDAYSGMLVNLILCISKYL